MAAKSKKRRVTSIPIALLPDRPPPRIRKAPESIRSTASAAPTPEQQLAYEVVRLLATILSPK